MKSAALLGTGLRPFAKLNIAAHSVSFSYTISRFLLYLIHLYYNFFCLFFSRPSLTFWSDRETSDFMTVKTAKTENWKSNNIPKCEDRMKTLEQNKRGEEIGAESWDEGKK